MAGEVDIWWKGLPASDAFDPTEYSIQQRRQRTPVGQTLAKKFPHLEYASIPKQVDPAKWMFRCDGEVESPFSVSAVELRKQFVVSTIIQDFHCITGWSVLDTTWGGVSGKALVEKVSPVDTVTSVLLHGLDEFSTSMWVEDFMAGMVAWAYLSAPLSPHHGFPLRYIAPPHLYQFKACKWITRVEFLTDHKMGFWEKRAYSDSALVADNDRYANPFADEGVSLGTLRRRGIRGQTDMGPAT